MLSCSRSWLCSTTHTVPGISLMAVLVRDATLTWVGLRLRLAAGAARRRITVRESLKDQLMPLPASSVCRAWATVTSPFRAGACRPSTSAVVYSRRRSA